jgi:hypothetical protein
MHVAFFISNTLPAPEIYLRKRKAKYSTTNQSGVTATCENHRNQEFEKPYKDQTSSSYGNKCSITLTDPFDLIFDAAINADLSECDCRFVPDTLDMIGDLND